MNLPTTQDVEKYFMTNPIPLKEKVCIIFHCEFSSHRGPVLYVHLLLLLLRHHFFQLTLFIYLFIFIFVQVSVPAQLGP